MFLSSRTIALPLLILAVSSLPALAQEQSVRPGINDNFRDPNPKEFVEKFEIESREVFAKRSEIVKLLKLKPTDTVADIGAGTGLFTRLFSGEVKEGKVVAVDIAQKFLDHIEITCREKGIRNVETLKCTDSSTELPEASIDVAFICDTYHHFEFPLRTMASIHQALKPGGRLVVVDSVGFPAQALSGSSTMCGLVRKSWSVKSPSRDFANRQNLPIC